MRVGILGGSFDPPHVGHLLVAQDALMELALDQLLVIPAAEQPLKFGLQAPSAQRLAMVALSFGGIAGIDVDPVEIDRGGLSFMVDTVETIRRRMPAAALHLLVGEDVLATLPRWREVDRLLAMVQLVVLTRQPSVRSVGTVSEHTLTGSSAVRHLATRRVDVSSTEIRKRIRDGRSIRGFVTDAVAAHIASAGLYLENSRESAIVELPERA